MCESGPVLVFWAVMQYNKRLNFQKSWWFLERVFDSKMIDKTRMWILMKISFLCGNSTFTLSCSKIFIQTRSSTFCPFLTPYFQATITHSFGKQSLYFFSWNQIQTHPSTSPIATSPYPAFLANFFKKFLIKDFFGTSNQITSSLV